MDDRARSLHSGRPPATHTAGSFDVRVHGSAGVMSGIGVQASLNRISFSVPKAAGARQLDIDVVIRGQSIPLRVSVTNAEPMWMQNAMWQKLVCAVDRPPLQWLALFGSRSQTIEGQIARSQAPPAGAAHGVAEGNTVKLKMAPFASLHKVVQNEIVAELQRLKRIEVSETGQPLLKVAVIGERTRDKNTGVVMRRFHVRSKAPDAQGHMHDYESIFAVTDRNEVKRLK